MKKNILAIILLFAVSAIAGPPAIPPPPPGAGSGDMEASDYPSLVEIEALSCTEGQIIKKHSGGAWECDEDASSGGVAGKVCKTVMNPSDADYLLFDIASARTITKVSGIAVGGTSVVVTLHDAGADGTGTAAIHNALTVDTDGANTGAISYAIDDGDVVKIDIGTVTGVVTQVMVCYE